MKVYVITEIEYYDIETKFYTVKGVRYTKEKADEFVKQLENEPLPINLDKEDFSYYIEEVEDGEV